MVDTGLIRQQAASAAAIVASARQGSGNTAQANINFEAGQTTLGPVAIRPAPECYCPNGRSIEGGGVENPRGPVGVMYRQSSRRTPNCPGR